MKKLLFLASMFVASIANADINSFVGKAESTQKFIAVCPAAQPIVYAYISDAAPYEQATLSIQTTSANRKGNVASDAMDNDNVYSNRASVVAGSPMKDGSFMAALTVNKSKKGVDTWYSMKVLCVSDINFSRSNAKIYTGNWDQL